MRDESLKKFKLPKFHQLEGAHPVHGLGFSITLNTHRGRLLIPWQRMFLNPWQFLYLPFSVQVHH